MASIATRYQEATERIAASCCVASRDPREVRVVAVSKTVDLPQIQEAVDAGIHEFAENRTSLFAARSQAFPLENWHFIGRIQTNKIKDFVGQAELVHSVSSLRALEAIEARAAKLCVVQPILFEVNVSGEESKDGFAPAALSRALESASTLAHVDVCGLMTMAPAGERGAARAAFGSLRGLRDASARDWEGCPHIHLTELSMGMSEDFDIAVEEGATIVRLGRTIFGGLENNTFEEL